MRQRRAHTKPGCRAPVEASYGVWTVIAEAKVDAFGHRRLRVRCSCGQLRVHFLAALRAGLVRWCRTCAAEAQKAAVVRRYGRWTVVGEGPPNHLGHRQLRLRCACGSEAVRLLSNLLGGKSLGCRGCYRQRRQQERPRDPLCAAPASVLHQVLTPAQLTIALLLGDGRRPADIAAQLGVSRPTISIAVRRARARLLAYQLKQQGGQQS